MPSYLFFRLTGETHPDWRGPLQHRIAFRKTSQTLLDEQELRDLIVDRIRDDRTGRAKEGRWMIIEFTKGVGETNRYFFDISWEETW